MSSRHLDALFAPHEVTVLGPPRTDGQQRLLGHLQSSMPMSRRLILAEDMPDWRCVRSLQQVRRIDLAVAFDGRLLKPTLIRQLGARGCRAMIWATDVPVKVPILEQARAEGLRLLGARSAGTARPLEAFNASAFDRPIQAGGIALFAQSRTIAAAALDWAEGRGLGLSLMATTGAEADVEIADLLDYAAVDPQTRAVVIQLSRIADGRRFMSAARACSRAKPVAILSIPDTRDAQPDPVRSAAFARAGLIECESLSGLFDALAALDRLSGLSDARLAVVGNGAGICGLGLGALARWRIPTATMETDWRRNVRLALPQARFMGAALDVGSAVPQTVARTIDSMLADDAKLAVLLLHAPEPGRSHETMARALFDCRHRDRIMTVWLGLATARDARAECAAHQLMTFVAPDDVARALGYLRRYRESREQLTQTPPIWEGHAPDRRRLARAMAAVCRPRASGSAVYALLSEYGVGRHGRETARGNGFRVRVWRHAEFGMALQVTGFIGGHDSGETCVLPPLDGLLARRVLEAVGYDPASEPSQREVLRLALALVRLAALVVEQPQIVTLSVRVTAVAGGTRCLVTEVAVSVTAQPLEARRRLALTPYPSALMHCKRLTSGACFEVRAIRPEDEPALVKMLQETDPNAIRLRFFRTIRYFSHAMAARLTQIDYDRELVLVATPCDETGDARSIVAVAHLSEDGSGDDDCAEYAILVHQNHTGVGLGRYLMEQILLQAARRGIRRVYGEVLAENTSMLVLCRKLGFTMRVDPQDPQCMRVEIAPDAFSVQSA